MQANSKNIIFFLNVKTCGNGNNQFKLVSNNNNRKKTSVKNVHRESNMFCISAYLQNLSII
jgi:hypothetical protein